MEWIKYSRKYCKIVSINAVVTALIYVIIAIIFAVLQSGLYARVSKFNENKNTIRATYPNYSSYDSVYAEKIFREYQAPGSEYRSFVGYRRKAYEGDAVNILDNGFRLSVNHAVDNSVWFLGGSTMWGTGSDDQSTIPSFFAELTNERVLNLGESGFNSFQELIQLEMMLAEGFLPKMVVFYDGVNDGYFFCQKDKFPTLRHAYTSRYVKQINKLKREKNIIDKIPMVNWGKINDNVIEFLSRPLRDYKKLKLVNENNSILYSDTPFNDVEPKNQYLFCNDKILSETAARLTNFSWNAAFSLLEKYNIPVFFVLQPTASYMPERYELDYIIDYKKKEIASERESYMGYYEAVKSVWKNTCEYKNNCSMFLDLSSTFFDIKDPIFIDNCHVSPNGNLHIAKRLREFIIR